MKTYRNKKVSAQNYYDTIINNHLKKLTSERQINLLRAGDIVNLCKFNCVVEDNLSTNSLGKKYFCSKKFQFINENSDLNNDFCIGCINNKIESQAISRFSGNNYFIKGFPCEQLCVRYSGMGGICIPQREKADVLLTQPQLCKQLCEKISDSEIQECKFGKNKDNHKCFRCKKSEERFKEMPLFYTNMKPDLNVDEICSNCFMKTNPPALPAKINICEPAFKIEQPPVIIRKPSIIDPVIISKPSIIDPVIIRKPSIIDPVIIRKPSVKIEQTPVTETCGNVCGSLNENKLQCIKSKDSLTFDPKTTKLHDCHACKTKDTTMNASKIDCSLCYSILNSQNTNTCVEDYEIAPKQPEQPKVIETPPKPEHPLIETKTCENSCIFDENNQNPDLFTCLGKTNQDSNFNCFKCIITPNSPNFKCSECYRKIEGGNCSEEKIQTIKGGDKITDIALSGKVSVACNLCDRMNDGLPCKFKNTNSNLANLCHFTDKVNFKKLVQIIRGDLILIIDKPKIRIEEVETLKKEMLAVSEEFCKNFCFNL